MLAKNPDDRFQTPNELSDALLSLDRDEESDSSSDPGTSGFLAFQQATTAQPTPPSMPAVPTSPEEPSPLPRKKPRTTVDTSITISDDVPDVLGITAEQRNAAAGQFARATEVIRTSGDATYTTQLLLSCCKLDPANLLYRKMLREVVRDATRGKRAGWLRSLVHLPARRRLRTASNAGDHRKVIECGEELLTQLPSDAATQLAMSAAAERLHLHALAAWLLEEARQQAPKDRSILSALAALYERQHSFSKAIAVWEQVRKNDPMDRDAATKIKDLAASDTIARGKFKG
jgi:hypothetical protein